MGKMAGDGAAVQLVSRPPLAMHGFRFSYRASLFDWRLLHGIDVEAVVRLTDVRAVEDCLDTLQHANFAAERGLSAKNCIHLFRLLQLATEYLWHLRNAHITLLDQYQQAVAAAERWKSGARLYLDTATQFLASCQATGDINRAALDALDDARRRLDEHDRHYNAALDKLEDEDQRARYFHFRKQRTELNWQALHAVDLDQMVANTDTSALDKVMQPLVYGSISAEDREELTPTHFAQLVPLAQCGLDYMLFQANATGQALEQAMVSLQTACAEIPSLTSATQTGHASVTAFITEAQARAAVQQQAEAAHIVQHHLQQQQLPGMPLAMPVLQHRPGTALGGPYGLARPMTPPIYSPAAAGLSGLPGMGGLVSVSPGSAPWAGAGGGGGFGSLYEEAMLLAQASMLGLPGPLAMHSRTTDVTLQVDALEQNLRVERGKTEEMRRLLGDIRDRLTVAPSGGGGGGGGHTRGLSSEDVLAAAYASGAGGGGPGLPRSLSQLQLMGGGGGPAGGGGGVRGGSPSKSRLQSMQQMDDDGARSGEDRGRNVMDALHQQVDALKAQALRQHNEARRGAGDLLAPQRSMSPPPGAGSGGRTPRDGLPPPGPHRGLNQRMPSRRRAPDTTGTDTDQEQLRSHLRAGRDSGSQVAPGEAGDRQQQQQSSQQFTGVPGSRSAAGLPSSGQWASSEARASDTGGPRDGGGLSSRDAGKERAASDAAGWRGQHPQAQDSYQLQQQQQQSQHQRGGSDWDAGGYTKGYAGGEGHSRERVNKDAGARPTSPSVGPRGSGGNSSGAGPRESYDGAGDRGGWDNKGFGSGSKGVTGTRDDASYRQQPDGASRAMSTPAYPASYRQQTGYNNGYDPSRGQAGGSGRQQYDARGYERYNHPESTRGYDVRRSGGYSEEVRTTGLRSGPSAVRTSRMASARSPPRQAAYPPRSPSRRAPSYG